MKFTKDDHIFEIEAQGDKTRLYYYGKESTGIMQFITWLCDDEAEAKDMIEAIIDPSRYADDEYRARHREEIMSMYKW